MTKPIQRRANPKSTSRRSIEGRRDRYMLPAGVTFEDPAYRTYFEELCGAVALTRGLLSSDRVVCAHAAAAAENSAHWRRIAKAIFEEGAEGGRPGFKEYETACKAAERSARHHQTLVASLGLRGRDMGSNRSRLINANAEPPANSKWADLGL